LVPALVRPGGPGASAYADRLQGAEDIRP
jgi:hypothetical protein